MSVQRVGFVSGSVGVNGNLRLLMCSPYQGRHIGLPLQLRLTQKDIADLVGASRKHVNQVMVSFKNQGLISVDSDGWITVHKREGLARYCE